MKQIIEIWWKNGARCFGIRNYKKSWKENGNKPRFCVHSNGAKSENGDVCFDGSLIIGYTVFNYTNFDLQKKWSKWK